VRVLVTGASGFIGSRVVERLQADGHEVVPFSRRTGGDVTDPASIEQAAQGVDAIAYLVAILDGTPERFEAVNAQGPANAVAAAKAAGVRRFLHMSALGVNEEHAPLTGYWGSKWKGVQAVMGSGLDWTVFEPSFVFARGGGAFAEFERLVRMPLTPSALMCRKRRTPAALAAATAFAGPWAFTASNRSGVPSRMATRWTMASAPCAAVSIDATSVTSPPVRRENRTTSCPSASSRSTTRVPTKPLAPVTSTLTACSPARS